MLAFCVCSLVDEVDDLLTRRQTSSTSFTAPNRRWWVSYISLCTHKSGSYMVTRTCATAQTSPPAEHIPLVAYDTQTDAHKMRREYTLVNGAVSLLSSSSLSFHHHRVIPPPRLSQKIRDRSLVCVWARHHDTQPARTENSPVIAECLRLCCFFFFFFCRVVFVIKGDGRDAIVLHGQKSWELYCAFYFVVVWIDPHHPVSHTLKRLSFHSV